jgi:hypothetical protein
MNAMHEIEWKMIDILNCFKIIKNLKNTSEKSWKIYDIHQNAFQ